MKKTILNILTSLTLLMILVGCGLNSKTTEDTSAKNTSDLLENLDKATNEEVSEEKENQKTSDPKKSDRENAKSRWQRSLAKEKNDKKAQAKLKKERAIADKEIKKDKKTISKNKEKDEDKEGAYTKIKAKFFGDTMAHIGQVQYALAYGGGDYDFSNQFSYIKDYVKDSDLAITNYETTSDPNKQYSGYPAFNTPASYLKNIKEAGFDVVTTANNHALDTDEEGVQTTIEAIKEAGLDFVGTKSKDSDKILYKEINGIKVAILAYTYGANGKEDLLDVRDEVSSLNYLKEENVKSDIEEAKKNSCDFIIVYPHWGIEYESYPTDETIKLAHKMVDWGADLVIGNHPHVVQPVEVYKSEDGREGIIAYALGNFISKQSLEVSGDIRVEQALSIEVTLEKYKKTGKKKLSDMKLHPLWVGTNYDQYGASSKTYLCEDFLEGGSKYDLVDDNMRARIQQAYDMTIKTAKTEVKE